MLNVSEHYLLLVSGVAVIVPKSGVNDISDFNDADLLPAANGLVVMAKGGGKYSLLIPEDAIDHLLNTDGEVYFYREGDVAIKTFVGGIYIERDHLLEARGAMRAISAFTETTTSNPEQVVLQT